MTTYVQPANEAQGGVLQVVENAVTTGKVSVLGLRSAVALREASDWRPKVFFESGRDCDDDGHCVVAFIGRHSAVAATSGNDVCAASDWRPKEAATAAAAAVVW